MHSEREAPGRVVVSDIEPGTVLAVLSGCVDFDSAAGVEGVLCRVLLERRPRMLVLSLVAVDFCDCAGLRGLIRVRSEGEELGCQVVISDASATVVWLLELFELDRSFGYPAVIPRPRASGGSIG